MTTGKATIRHALNQTLTNSFADTVNQVSSLISEESIASLEIQYVTGAAETGSSLSFIVYHSWNNIDWVPETVSSIVSGVDTLTTLEHRVSGGAGSTTYSSHYVIPLCSRYLKIKVKENNVGANYGTVTIAVTQAAGSGQARNIQSTASSGTVDVNLTEVNGSGISLGQKTMANSLPVVISSDQSDIDVDIAKFGGASVSLGQKTTAQSMPVTLPSDISTLVTAIEDLGVMIRTYLAAISNPVYIDQDCNLRMPTINAAQSGTWTITNISQIGGYDASGTVQDINTMSANLQLRQIIS